MPRDIYEIGRDAWEYLEREKKTNDQINSLKLRNLLGKVPTDVWKALTEHNTMDTRLIDLVMPCEGCPSTFCMEVATVEGWRAIKKEHAYCGQGGDCLG
jgi:uncharacterized protein YcbK (DUF882 family)